MVTYRASNVIEGTKAQRLAIDADDRAKLPDNIRFFETDTNDMYRFEDTGDAWSLISGNDVAEIFKLKTFDDHITMQKVSAVGNQASDYGAIYIDTSDGKLYFKYQSAAAVDLTLSGTAVTLAGLSDTTLDGNEAAGHILIYDGSNSWDNKIISGDVSLAVGGGVTVLDTVITGKTELDANPAGTDFIVVSDTSVSSGDKLRKVTITNLQSDLQPLDTGLTSISGLTTAANRMIYTTGSDTYAVTNLTAAGRSILDDASVTDIRNTLALGTTDNVEFNNVIVGGVLTVNTTTTVSSTVINVADSLIALANGNAANSLDIGFYGLYVDSGSKYSGLVRDASDGKWKLFTGLTDAPAASTVNAAHGTFGTGTLVAALEGNATTATALAAGVTIASTGDVVWTSASFTGAGNVTGVAAIGDLVIVNGDINANAGIVDTKLATIATADKVSLTALNIDGGTVLADPIADADLFIVDDAGAGVNRKVGAAALKTYVGSTASGMLVADTTDTTCFVALFDTATGASLPIKTDASNLIYNATTGVLTVTSLGAFTLAGKLTAGSSEIEGSAFDINGGDIAGCDITVGSSKTLDVSGGTLSLANDQISGDKVEGGTIAAVTISDATITTGNITVGSGKTLTVSAGTLTTSAAQNLVIVQGAASNIDVGAYTVRASNFLADSHTATRVFFAGANGALTSDSDLTFATDTLTATKIGAFEAAGAINFASQNLTLVNIDSGSADGLTSLTIANNVDVGGYEIRALKFQSDQAPGTAPLTVASTTVVTNLNADLLDGVQGASYATLTGAEVLASKTLTTPLIVDGGSINCGTHNSGANQILIFDTVVSAVNELTISNAATGGSALIAASGGDNDAGIILKGKGIKGVVVTNATVNGAFLEFDAKVASSTFSAQGAETARLYLKEINSNNNALAVKIQKAGAMQEVELTSPKAVCGECGSTDGASDPTYDFSRNIMILDLWCGHSYEVPMQGSFIDGS